MIYFEVNFKEGHSNVEKKITMIKTWYQNSKGVYRIKTELFDKKFSSNDFINI